jgi:catechol 2,3-dioxygenase-like lactoylglutathione lyase family enzyme
VEKATGVRATVEIAPRVHQSAGSATAYNGPGRIERHEARAPGVLRTERVQPRKLGHAVLGTTDLAVTQSFFLDGLGFKLSDRMKDIGAFMRCSTDHHNVLVLRAPVSFLHHTSWQVDDIDDVGRGDAAGPPGTARLGSWPALRRIQLLLVPEGPGGQLQRVLLRHGLRHR